MITSLDLLIGAAAVPAGMSVIRMYLYSASPPSAYADNAVWDLPSGDRSSFVGYVEFPAITDLGSTLFTQLDNAGKQVKLNGTSLFAYIVTSTGFTPAANSESYTATLRAVSL
jgi:hypothetical protein